MLRFEKLKARSEFEKLETLASAIWYEHYTPIIGKEQVAYMMKKFQSVAYMLRQSDKENYQYYIAKKHEEDVGYFSFKLKEEELFLSKFYLLQESRGKGYGRYMLEFLELCAMKAGKKHIRLTVNKYNSDSIAAYEAMGFRILEPVIFDIGGGYIMDDYRMEKKLG